MGHLIINPSAVAETVRIIKADGKEDTIQIAPKGRAHLADGQEVHPIVSHSNPNIIVHKAKAKPQPAPVVESED